MGYIGFQRTDLDPQSINSVRHSETSTFLDGTSYGKRLCRQQQEIFFCFAPRCKRTSSPLLSRGPATCYDTHATVLARQPFACDYCVASACVLSVALGRSFPVSVPRLAL